MICERETPMTMTPEKIPDTPHLYSIDDLEHFYNRHRSIIEKLHKTRQESKKYSFSLSFRVLFMPHDFLNVWYENMSVMTFK